MEDRKTWLTVSILKLTPQAPMTVHCTVFNDVFPAPKTSEPLEISLRGFIKPEQISFVKNKPLELLCNENETKKEKYKWILNGKELKGETENTLNILQINESYDNSKVKCLILGKNSAYEALNAFSLVYDKQRKDIRREKTIVVATMDDCIVSYTSKGKKIWSIKLNSNIICLEPMDIISRGVQLAAIALANR